MNPITYAALFLLAATLSASGTTRAANFVVDTLDDTEDFVLNGICADRVNRCSLRAAIQESNHRAGEDSIGFVVGGRISLDQKLPRITDPVFLDGFTSPNTVDLGDNHPPRPGIILDGVGLQDLESFPPDELLSLGLELASGSGGSFVGGLSIVNFQHGDLVVSADTADGSVFSGLWIGVEPDRTPVQHRHHWLGRARFEGNGHTIGQVWAGANGTAGRGNVFFGDVHIAGDNILFAANRVGANASGTWLLNRAVRSGVIVSGNNAQIGVPAPADSAVRNVIGTLSVQGGDSAVIVGNFIGRTRGLGSVEPLHDTSYRDDSCISLSRSSGARVGDGTPLGRNFVGGGCAIGVDVSITRSEHAHGQPIIVDGNDFRALSTAAYLSGGHVVFRNNISVAGDRPGEGMKSRAQDLLVEGNTFDSFAVGVREANYWRASTTAIVRNNFFRNNSTAIYAVSDTSESFAEITIPIDITGNRIEGTTRDALIINAASAVIIDNDIVGSERNGIVATQSDQGNIVMRGNSFRNNCQLGIDTEGTRGREVNDSGDADEIWEASNYPEIVNAYFGHGSRAALEIEYRVDNLVAEEYPIGVEIYLADHARPNQGSSRLASLSYNPKVMGTIVSASIPLPRSVRGGALVATATPKDRSTSEFSYPVLFGRTSQTLTNLDDCNGK